MIAAYIIATIFGILFFLVASILIFATLLEDEDE